MPIMTFLPQFHSLYSLINHGLVIFAAAIVVIIDTILILFFLDYVFGGEDFRTNQEAIEEIAHIIRQEGKSGGRLYDLGSSRGNFCIEMKRILPECEIIGIDNSIIRVYFARLRALMTRSDVTFQYKDILEADLSNATMFNIYLPSGLLPQLLERIRASGSRREVFMYRIGISDLAATVETRLADQKIPTNQVRMYII